MFWENWRFELILEKKVGKKSKKSLLLSLIQHTKNLLGENEEYSESSTIF